MKRKLLAKLSKLGFCFLVSSLPNLVQASECCDNCTWVEAKYLTSWFKRGPLSIPLVTSSLEGTPQRRAGVLGDPNTIILFDKHNMKFQSMPGVELAAGTLFGPDHCFGLEVKGFSIFSKHLHYQLASNAASVPIIARPYTDTTFGPDAVLISFPGFDTGEIAVDAKSRLFGIEVNGNRYHDCVPCVPFKVTFGFRYLDLKESLKIQTQSVSVPPVASFNNFDLFKTHNQFYGVQLGGAFSLSYGCAFMNLFGKFGIGYTHQIVNIDGQNARTVGGVTEVTSGDLFSQITNIGTYHQNRFSVVPEAGIDFGVEIFPCVRLLAGYSFVYWNKVVRPGSEIDPVVNPTLFPPAAFSGPARPAFTFNQHSFFAHTVSVGINANF